MSEQNLSNKELKELKKQQKAARRAAQKEATGQTSSASQNSPASSANSAANVVSPAHSKSKTQPSSSQIKKSINKHEYVAPEISKVPQMYSHLSVHESRRNLPVKIVKMIHPKIMELSQKYTSCTIVGSTMRCKAMLDTFKFVVQDFVCPPDVVIFRGLTAYLSYQIDYLKNSRPLSVTMGNAIRWLKQEISVLSPEISEQDAKITVIEKIDAYIREKIEYTDKSIIQYAAPHITNQSTILTFGHSHVLEELLIYCQEEQNKSFTVIIIDSRPLFEGKTLLKNLVARGFKNCKYYLITSLTNILEEIKIDYVFLGAHAMLSNGRLYSRVGTALISMMANKKNIPVLVCCESIKFSERIQLDSATQNELGDFENLMTLKTEAPAKKNPSLELYIEQKKIKAKKQKGQTNQKAKNDGPIIFAADNYDSPIKSDIKSVEYLKVLNIMYDLTPPHYIDKIITEHGALPPSSVPVIVREYKDEPIRG